MNLIDFLPSFGTTVLALHALIVLVFTFRILLRDDLSPPARLAWFVILLVLPYLGSAIYFLFGENDLGHVSDERHRRAFDAIRSSVPDIMGNADDLPGLVDPFYRPAFLYAASINGFQPVPGNAAELMTDADATRTRMVADIDAATDHVHVLSYIWLEDGTGTELAEALIRAARRGVICRAMADGLGSRALIHADLWRRMGEAGVHLAIALPFRRIIRTLLTSRIDLRNHRKIAVIDGAITYCGSRNAADPAFLPKARYGPWVDIMLRFTGPVVAQNQILFASDWAQATDSSPVDIVSRTVDVSDGFPAQVIGVGPTERRWATPQFFACLIGCAQHSLTISTPYFVPDTTVLDALCAAALRGVTVMLIFPARNDSWVVAAASRSYYRRLIDAGCLIREYESGLLHAKSLTMDGRVSLVGSSNLDLRSFDLNYENNILLQDTATTALITARQQDYLASSKPVGRTDILAWPWYRRIWQNAVATVGPVL